MKLNYNEIQNKTDELEYYKGYLPSLIQMQINYDKYIEFLKKEGLYEELFMKLSKSRHYSRNKRELELKQWISSNPQFKDFIID